MLNAITLCLTSLSLVFQSRRAHLNILASQGLHWLGQSSNVLAYDMWHAGCFSAPGVERCESSGKRVLFGTRRSASQGHSASAAALCSVSLTAQHRRKEGRSHEAHSRLAGSMSSQRRRCTGEPVSRPVMPGVLIPLAIFHRTAMYYPRSSYSVAVQLLSRVRLFCDPGL